MLASFLFPTRGRLPQLLRSVHLLWELASDPECFEVLVRADDDDKETVELAGDLAAAYPQAKLTTGPRCLSDLDLHLMRDDLAARAHGRFVFLVNDDIAGVPRGWDDVLRARLADLPETPRSSTARDVFPWALLLVERAARS